MKTERLFYKFYSWILIKTYNKIVVSLVKGKLEESDKTVFLT